MPTINRFTFYLWLLVTLVLGPILMYCWIYIISSDNPTMWLDGEFVLFILGFGFLLSIPTLLILLIVSYFLYKSKINLIQQFIIITTLTIFGIIGMFALLDSKDLWIAGYLYISATIISAIVLTPYFIKNKEQII